MINERIAADLVDYQRGKMNIGTFKLKWNMLPNEALKLQPDSNQPTTTFDPVNHPEHYKGTIETIDYLKSLAHELPNWSVGYVWNVIKYVSRFDRKDKLKDLDKAMWYLTELRKDAEIVYKKAPE